MMLYMHFYLIWGCGTNDTFVFISCSLLRQIFPKFRLLFSTFTCYTSISLSTYWTLRPCNWTLPPDWVLVQFGISWRAPSPPASSISVAHKPKAKRSPFQLISGWSLELKHGLEWHPHLAVTSYPKIPSPLLSVCSHPHLSLKSS